METFEYVLNGTVKTGHTVCFFWCTQKDHWYEKKVLSLIDLF